MNTQILDQFNSSGICGSGTTETQPEKKESAPAKELQSQPSKRFFCLTHQAQLAESFPAGWRRE
ncbi:hypothetical protein [Nodularia sphaerocarpa]|uniref:hypothetical protein n=1 Tax=Nodularia sphaerocarpa TaxID=137816 RepID=UPI001EFBE041|nr:hypothetical protein [Nodularia sphaerocarpa]MDB9373486.1 hypothetical protein [Nodularia sphaerocarpa CS-585]MDB9377596.1 hypothetical protein [Nodularia sphaerocarpa CS-585A2]